MRINDLRESMALNRRLGFLILNPGRADQESMICHFSKNFPVAFDLTRIRQERKRP
jgi:hypothetical protein